MSLGWFPTLFTNELLALFNDSLVTCFETRVGEVWSCDVFLNSFNPFPPKPAKTSPFVILLCLMPDDFTSPSGWEKVNM